MLNNITAFLCLLFTTIASAAPIGDEPVTTTGNAVGYGTGGGIAGLIILILDIIVIGKSSASSKATPLHLPARCMVRHNKTC